MGARFYDPALGRWLSADTIVPDPEDPQAFNRYSYVKNHPVNAVDPSGHSEIRPPMIEGVSASIRAFPKNLEALAHHVPISAKERRRMIQEYAIQKIDEGATSLEAWASTAGYAATLSGGDPDVFMRDASRVFTGFTQRLAPLHWLTQQVIGDSPHKVIFQSDGFNDMLADPDITNDQVRHCWFYTQIAYTWGGGIASWGNIWHEWGPGQTGQSDQDLWAGFYGAYLGYLLDEGLISVYEVEEWIREHFGEETEQQEP